MSRWALIPIKGFDRGKSRLSEVLAPSERADLARALFEHVVQVLRESPDIDAIAAVSDSPHARACSLSPTPTKAEDWLTSWIARSKTSSIAARPACSFAWATYPT